MRKFICKESGAVLMVTNEFVVKQLVNNSAYEELVEEATKKEKSVKDFNKKELVAYLSELGIEANEDMKKDELLALVPEE